MQIRGSVAVVTGGAHGIGAAIVEALVDAGAAGVLVADLNQVGAQRLVDALPRPAEPGQDPGGADPQVQLLAHHVDVADPHAVAAMIDRAERALGPVDLVVSNAGIGTGAGLDAPLEAWTRSYEVNVLAHVHAARAALPGMLERGGGAFVHTASAAGLLTMVGDAPYAVTKHGAVAFAEWLALTYGSRGIQVGCLCPQGVETDLLRNAVGSLPEQVVRATGPVLSPEEVAAATVAGIEDGRFLILPHPEVATHVRRKAEDPERWLAAMRALSDQLTAGSTPPPSAD
ncbi:MAG: SDR family oxidoreductase [Nitriliruptoraceae bacterium]|nr:SDR family oxidoreductase [Nitriliruptoraceae bacterium]